MTDGPRVVSDRLTPLGRLLGSSGDPIACKVLAEGIGVHWYPQGAAPGDACLCGVTTMRDPGALDEERHPGESPS